MEGKKSSAKKKGKINANKREEHKKNTLFAGRNTPAMRRLRKKRRRKILALLTSFLLLFGVGTLGIYLLQDGNLEAGSLPYQVEEEFFGSMGNGTDETASGMAQNLCVTTGDVALAGVELPEEQSGALFDLDNKKVLYSQGIYQRVYPASITKIMTAMLALRYGDLEEMITVGPEVTNLEAGSQVCGLWVGDRVSLDQLLHALLVYSGNDAAAAIAVHIGGTIEDFVTMMNDEATRLGCTGTHFTNPHGLQNTEHYTTPYDIYLMLQEALTYKEFVDMIQLGNYSLETLHEDGTTANIPLEATDHYLTGESTPPKDVTILGGKTGTTSLAGNCLALAVQDAYGKPYISIVMGANTKELLYEQMNMLLEKINQ